MSRDSVAPGHARWACSACRLRASIDGDFAAADADAGGAAGAGEPRGRGRGPSRPALRDDAVYGTYFRMLESGVPQARVKEKMRGDGVDPSVLDRDAAAPLSAAPPPAAAASAAAAAAHSVMHSPIAAAAEQVSPPARRPSGTAADDARAASGSGGVRIGDGGGAPAGARGADGGSDTVVAGAVGGSSRAASEPASGPREALAPPAVGSSDGAASALTKYTRMVDLGVPVEAVRQRMRRDGVAAPDVERFGALAATNPTPAVPATAASTDSSRGEPDTGAAMAKYRRMAGVGVALDAVRQRMRADGVAAALIDAFGDEPHPPPPPAAVAVGGDAPADALAKYRKMVAMGVPVEAVRARMRGDGIASAVVAAFPGDVGAPGADAASAVPAKSVPRPPGPPPPRAPGPVPRVPVTPPAPPAAAPAQPPPPLHAHPVYAEFFRLLKVGVPIEVVRGKMALESLDPRVLDCDPNAPLPAVISAGAAKPQGEAPSAPTPAKKATVMRKRLHWDAVAADDIDVRRARSHDERE